MSNSPVSYMSNFSFNLESSDPKHLEMAFEILLDADKSITHYQIVDNKRLNFWSFLTWNQSKGRSEIERDLSRYNLDPIPAILPFEPDPIDLCNLTKAWLKKADYGDEPDHDGSNTRFGFLITNRSGYHRAFGRDAYFNDPFINLGWGHGVICVEPRWAEHHK